MRLQSKKPVLVKNKTIGGKIPLICLPLVAKDQKQLLSQADELITLNPDILEWRVDGFSRVDDIDNCIETLTQLNTKISQFPLIFTCRIESEGGMQTISREKRLNLITRSVKTGFVDIVDIELCNDKAFIESIIESCRENDTKVILSFHDFKKTPTQDFILEKLISAQDLGADIVKLAAMPEDHADVLALMNATLTARKTKIDVPIVTMSMGETGGVSRIAGGIFGSDITFAIGKRVSAPGQIRIKELRQAMSVLYC